MIIKYVKDKYNLKISSNNIAEVKRKYGIYTQRTSAVAEKYPYSDEKAEAIEDALRYYKFLQYTL